MEQFSQNGLNKNNGFFSNIYIIRMIHSFKINSMIIWGNIFHVSAFCYVLLNNLVKWGENDKSLSR